jgi:hypothetical protein
MKPRQTPEPAKIYQLKIELKFTKPTIWRRLLIRGDVYLDELEHYIKLTMGWVGWHMHDFCFDGVYYGDARSCADLDFEDETKSKLSDLITEAKQKFTYTYDFGDDWRHQITVEKIMDADPELAYPICVKGAGACPPDDCGGVPGFYHMISVLKDPKHPEHRSMRNWVGYDFDPNEFSVAWVNKKLQQPSGKKTQKRPKTKAR